MPLLLLALFIGVPRIEIAVFIKVGGEIGIGATVAVVILTALIGTWLLRAQGLATLERARAQMDRGVLPGRELFDGACLLFAGALLLTPGFVTDSVGFLLFLPPVRDWLRQFFGRRLAGSARTRVFMDGEEVDPHHPRRPKGGRNQEGVIDADYEDVTESDDPRIKP